MGSEAKLAKTRHRRAWGTALLVLMVLTAAMWWRFQRPTPSPSSASSAKVQAAVQKPPLIDYNALPEDRRMQGLMEQRRADYGVGEVLDLIVGKNETLRIGDATVSMAEIDRQIAMQEGRIVEGSLGDDGPAGAMPAHSIYGIHVVRPGDNIWNIHFKLLKAYFGRKGVALSPLADEPRQNGSSSGVGRLLKFSEHMVYIYNLREHRLDDSIELIHPLSKIVVYNMGQVFALLDPIDYGRIDHIRFDGETLWLPAPQ